MEESAYVTYVNAIENVVGTVGSNLDNGRHGEVRQEFLPEPGVALIIRAQEHCAGNPAVPLVEIGVASFAGWVVVVLRVQERREVRRIIDGVRVGPPGAQFHAMRASLR